MKNQTGIKRTLHTVPENSHSFYPSFSSNVSETHESVGWLRLQLYFEGMSQRAALKMLRTIQVDNKSGRTSAGPCSHYRAAQAGSEAQNWYTGEKASKDEGGLQASLSHPLKADENSSWLLLRERQNKRECDTTREIIMLCTRCLWCASLLCRVT